MPETASTPLRRTLVVTRRVLRQMARDKRTAAMIVLQPIVMLAVFGYAFGTDVNGVVVAVAVLDQGDVSADVLERVDPEVLTLVTYATEAEVERAVREQEARVGVVFPANFTSDLAATTTSPRDPARLVYYADNTNPSVTGGVRAEFLKALDAAAEARGGIRRPLTLDERVVFGSAEGRSIDFMLPGIVAMTVFLIGAMLTVVSIVKERVSGTLQRILASPARGLEVVAGFALAFATFSLAQAVTVLTISVVLFDVHVEGSIFLALFTTLLVSVTALGLGILLSALSKNEFQATQSVMLVAFPSMFLAGIFAPIEAMPAWVRPLTKAIPLSYAVTAEREVINHGAGLADVGGSLVTLAAFAAAFLALGAWSFTRRSA